MNRRTFKSHVNDIIWDAVKQFSNVNRHTEMSMYSKSNGFFFKFHRYGEDLRLQVCPEGNLVIHASNDIIADRRSTYYAFRDEDDHEKLLPIIQKDIDSLVKDFYKGSCCILLQEPKVAFLLHTKLVPSGSDSNARSAG